MNDEFEIVTEEAEFEQGDFIIEYEEDYDTEKEKRRFSDRKRIRLIEQFVDEGYELPRVDPATMRCLENLREYFKHRKDEPIPFKELRLRMYDCRTEYGRPYKKQLIVMALREMWRAGLIRRFVRGRSRRGSNPHTKFQNRGNWWGVHYILYPKEVSDE